MSGICALCQQQAALAKSHLLPAGLFKAIAQTYAPYDFAPVMIDTAKGTALQTNLQVRKSLLCENCEQLFSRNGENHVIANCYRKNGEFKLRDAIKNQRPTHIVKDRAVFFGDQLGAEFRAGAYQYFLISVLWRTSVTQWPGVTGVKKG